MFLICTFPVDLFYKSDMPELRQFIPWKSKDVQILGVNYSFQIDVFSRKLLGYHLLELRPMIPERSTK